MPFRAFWRFAHFPSVRVDSRSTHALVPVEDDATLADGFDARTFIGKGDAFNSPAFASQAQAVLRADPRDHNRLDLDRDGIACESLKAPRDTTPVKR